MTNLAERLSEILAKTNSSPVYSYMGMKVAELGEGSSHLTMDFKEGFRNIHGIAHGGIIATLMDACCGLALYGVVKENEKFVTIDLRINYISPFTTGKLDGRGKAVHWGRKIAVSEGEIKDHLGNLVAKGMATYYILPNKSDRI